LATAATTLIGTAAWRLDPLRETDLKIDIISDVVCPWCIIGYKRLEKALAMLDLSHRADIHWHPFELNPNLPKGGQDLYAHAASRYGADPAAVNAAQAERTAIGNKVGFSFNYNSKTRVYNTRKSHKLIQWSKKIDRQTTMKLKLFEAYFTRQLAIDDVEVLVTLAEEIGLDGQQAKSILLDTDLDREIKLAEQQWETQAIQSIPGYIFNDQQIVSGVKSTNTFLQTINNLGHDQN
jgi:predicted DsbA family dithiol-disulfide isomerase